MKLLAAIPEIKTMADAVGEGLKTTVVGLAIVFSVLLILMFVLMAMKAIFYKDPAKQKTEEAPAAAEASVPSAAEAEKADDTDEEELIAVLTAAVAASLNTSTYNLRIKSYRRTDNNAPAWNKAGLRDTIQARF